MTMLACSHSPNISGHNHATINGKLKVIIFRVNVNDCMHSPCVYSTVYVFAGLTMHATILAFMFSLVEEDKISAPLYNLATMPAATNAVYIQQHVAEIIKQAYTHLQE